MTGVIGLSVEQDTVEHLESSLSVLSHELGNSVNSLKITLEMLLRNSESIDREQQSDFLRRALEQVGRQHRFLNAIRSYSNVNVGKLAWTRLDLFWESFIGPVRERMAAKGIDFKAATPRSSVLILTNQRSLLSALAHLVENAEDAVEGASDPEVEIVLDEGAVKTGYLRIMIRDNGSGIAPPYQTRIYIPFFTTKPGRAGMGLALARKVLTRSDGFLNVRSRRPRGAAASVWLRAANSESALPGNAQVMDS
jgi:signal transduction histidine kinase